MHEKYIYGETFSPEAPRLTATVYEVLSRHLATGSDDPETHMVLNDVYKALGSSEQETVAALDGLEQRGVIRREDTLVLAVLLIASKTLGPDLDFLRQAILTGNFDADAVGSRIAAAGMDQSISNFLREIVPKLKRES
jgi:hypothetical protein